MSHKYVTVVLNEGVMENDPHALVSVIVPIYNAEPYLDQALQSIRDQRYRHLEIICLNDGSTDNSLEIMRSHADVDARIKIIDKQNEGYGATCNRGIAEATGEWIAIVEPDDWIDENMYGDMLMFASSFMTKIDIVKTPYWRVTNPDRTDQHILNCPLNKRVTQSTRPFKIEEEPELLLHHPCIWSAIYRKSFLDKNHIRFLPIPGAGWADNPFMIEAYCQAKSIVYLDRAFYFYREETGVKNAKFHMKQWKVPFGRWLDMQETLERLGVTDERVLAAHIKRGFTYAGGVLEHHRLKNNPELADALKQMFEKMNPELVWANKDVPPNQKKLYAKILDVEYPHLNRAEYFAGVMGKGVYALGNVGISATFGSLTSFLKTFESRARGLRPGSTKRLQAKIERQAKKDAKKALRNERKAEVGEVNKAGAGALGAIALNASGRSANADGQSASADGQSASASAKGQSANASAKGQSASARVCTRTSSVSRINADASRAGKMSASGTTTSSANASKQCASVNE